MDIPIEEQQMFQNVTCNIAASEHEITEPNMLAMDLINNVSFSDFKRKSSYQRHFSVWGTERKVNLSCRSWQRFLGWKS